MTSGLVLGLVAAVCWGLTDVTASLGGRRLGSLLTLAIAQLTSIVVLLGVAFVIEGGIPDLSAALPTAIAMGALAVVGYVAFFASLRIGPLSVVSPTVAAYGGLTVLLAVLLLGEVIRPVQWAGAGLATAGPNDHEPGEKVRRPTDFGQRILRPEAAAPKICGTPCPPGAARCCA